MTPNWKNLNVNNNNLKSLPKSLGDINALGVISAGSNKLKTVPSEFGQLANLALLSITTNPLTSIPSDVCALLIANGGILTLLTDAGVGCD